MGLEPEQRTPRCTPHSRIWPTRWLSLSPLESIFTNSPPQVLYSSYLRKNRGRGPIHQTKVRTPYSLLTTHCSTLPTGRPIAFPLTQVQHLRWQAFKSRKQLRSSRCLTTCVDKGFQGWYSQTLS